MLIFSDVVADFQIQVCAAEMSKTGPFQFWPVMNVLISVVSLLYKWFRFVKLSRHDSSLPLEKRQSAVRFRGIAMCSGFVVLVFLVIAFMNSFDCGDCGRFFFRDESKWCVNNSISSWFNISNGSAWTATSGVSHGSIIDNTVDCSRGTCRTTSFETIQDNCTLQNRTSVNGSISTGQIVETQSKRLVTPGY